MPIPQERLETFRRIRDEHQLMGHQGLRWAALKGKVQWMLDNVAELTDGERGELNAILQDPPKTEGE